MPPHAGTSDDTDVSLSTMSISAAGHPRGRLGRRLKIRRSNPSEEGLDGRVSMIWSRRGLVGRGGLEPPTSRLSGVRSNHLSYRPEPGGAYRDRTDDLLNANQALSQLS